MSAGATVGIGLAVGACVFAPGGALAFLARGDKSANFKEWVQLVGFAGTRELRATFSEKAARWRIVCHKITFDLMLKYAVIPVSLGAPFVLARSAAGQAPLWSCDT